jgi:acyl carrier protein
MTTHVPPTPTRQSITAWLIQWTSEALTVPADEIDPTKSLLDYSLSSVTATMLVGDLEDWLGLTLPPTLVWDYPSIDVLVDYLVGQVEAAATVPPSPNGTNGPPASTGAWPEVGAADAQRLLSNLDNLSDEEVNNLLSQLMANS